MTWYRVLYARTDRAGHLLHAAAMDVQAKSSTAAIAEVKARDPEADLAAGTRVTETDPPAS